MFYTTNAKTREELLAQFLEYLEREGKARPFIDDTVRGKSFERGRQSAYKDILTVWRNTQFSDEMKFKDS